MKLAEQGTYALNDSGFCVDIDRRYRRIRRWHDHAPRPLGIKQCPFVQFRATYFFRRHDWSRLRHPCMIIRWESASRIRCCGSNGWSIRLRTRRNWRSGSVVKLVLGRRRKESARRVRRFYVETGHIVPRDAFGVARDSHCRLCGYRTCRRQRARDCHRACKPVSPSWNWQLSCYGGAGVEHRTASSGGRHSGTSAGRRGKG